MLTSFFHTGFVVSDLEAAIDFYTDVMGLTLTGRTERTGEFPSTLLGFPDTHIRGAFLEMGGGHQLELIQYMNPVGGVADFDKNNIRAAHLAFFVADIDRFYEDTRQRGLTYGTPPVAMYDDAGAMLRKALYCQDPDGNWLELVELY
jgi:catechol 2,3-dioxygenase-like lactoylglutathione lyase family enzyme